MWHQLLCNDITERGGRASEGLHGGSVIWHYLFLACGGGDIYFFSFPISREILNLNLVSGK